MTQSKRTLRPIVIVCAAVVQLAAWVGTSPAQAEDAKPRPVNLMIELLDVPKELTLPAESRMNLFVTALVRGPDTPAEVWLAREADGEHRVAIPGIGEGRYQLNLADDRVVLALRRTGGRGQCYVFARTADGRVTQSAAIRFYTTGPCVSFTTDTGATRNGWYRTDQVKTLLAELDPPMPGVRVIASAAGQTWTLDPRQADETFGLAVGPEIASAWERAGTLKLTTSKGELIGPRETAFRAIPRTLDVPPGGLTIRVNGSGTNRPAEASVPGSNDYLYFRLLRVSNDGKSADITLHRRDDEPKDVDPPLGHVEAFQLPGGQYAWELTAVQPAGRPQDAYAEVTIHAGAIAEERLIRRLIDFTLANTSSEVLRFNNNKYGGRDAATQLNKLYAAATDRTLASFLRAIEAREKEVGSVATIHPEGHRPAVSLGQWLRDSLRAAGWEPLGGAGVNAPMPAAQAPASTEVEKRS